MLTTPFGKIEIYADNVLLDYETVAHTFDRGPVKGHPIAGCYRIHIPVGSYRSIRCEVELTNVAIRNTGASGERYMDAEFISGTTILTIGAEDENLEFDTVHIERGVEHRINGSVSEVVFGIAWATDYEGASDCRTWYAADPTFDRK